MERCWSFHRHQLVLPPTHPLSVFVSLLAQWKRRLIWWEVDVLFPPSKWQKKKRRDNLWTHHFLTKTNPGRKLALWAKGEFWLKLNNHLNRGRGGTIEDLNLCSRFSSFVISCSTCAAPSHINCSGVSVPPSFHLKLKGWQMQPLPSSLNPAALHEVDRPPPLPRSRHRNGHSRSKWTEELSCVLNSLLLSLGPVAVAHQTASLFSSGEEVQVCDELVTKSLYVQINSALCGSAAKWHPFSEKNGFFLTQAAGYLQNLGRSGAGHPLCDEGQE